MKFTSSKKWAIAAAAAFLGLGAFAPAAMAADHRDSTGVDAIPEGDYTDVFAFVDPANNNNVVLMGVVNPFLAPSEAPSASFAEDLLYQIKINNNMANGETEDLVVQFKFSGSGPTQTYTAILGTPTTTGSLGTEITNGTVVCPAGTRIFTGQPNGVTEANAVVPNAVGGSCFAGLRDDSFQTDVSQAVFRIGLNSNKGQNAAQHSQDMFRGYGGTRSLLGGLRGREIRPDGTSGNDGFGGFDTTAFAVSIPKTLLRGSGIPDVSQRGAINSSLIGVWGTVGRPTSESFDGFTASEGGKTFAQFERMGQQLFNTVFVFQQPIVNSGSILTGTAFAAGCPSGPQNLPASNLSAAQLKNLHNAVNPVCDAALFDRFFLDSLTVAGNGPATPAGTGLIGGLLGTALPVLFPAGSSGSNNTVGNRATLLTLLGFNSAALTGVPLYSGAASLQNNSNPRLQAQLQIPDYMRLNVDQATDGIRPAAGTAGNESPTLALSKWGLQNGRRPADDVTDILLRITRETADVKFGDNLVLPGVGANLPGGGPNGSRRSVNCNELSLSGGVGLVDALNTVTGGVTGLLNSLSNDPSKTLSDNLAGYYTINVLTPCEDARVFAVVQGTDWIKSDPRDVISVANQTSNERPGNSSFPYLAVNPAPGEPGTSQFPAQ
ncbi:MAG: hypothetical protein NVS9B10_23650 [Nevskia sp.]